METFEKILPIILIIGISLFSFKYLQYWIKDFKGSVELFLILTIPYSILVFLLVLVAGFLSAGDNQDSLWGWVVFAMLAWVGIGIPLLHLVSHMSARCPACKACCLRVKHNSSEVIGNRNITTPEERVTRQYDSRGQFTGELRTTFQVEKVVSVWEHTLKCDRCSNIWVVKKVPQIISFLHSK
jgi:hypothetical protein